MSAPADLRVGWCPGALRPMMSGDGLIVRVKPRGATLTVEQALGISAAAARHGNGLLDLTGRANLQVRGVTDKGLSALTSELDALGLLDADAGAESRRNVLTSPLAGLDPTAAFDIRPAVAALETALAGARDVGDLPSKFGVAVSDGGRITLAGASADIRFEAAVDGRFAVRLDGDDRVAASCTAHGIPQVALDIIRTFAERSTTEPGFHRMRDLVARIGVETVLDGLRSLSHVTEPHSVDLSLASDGAGQTASPARVEEGRGTSSSGPRMDPTSVQAAGDSPDVPARVPPCVGAIELGDTVALGVAAPFGRLDAGRFAALARGAARAGAGEIRVTPWRVVFVPGLSREAADRLAADCGAVGLIVDAADPRLRVVACPGAPGCRRGTTPVLEHAASWARLLGSGDPSNGTVLHVSGCAKGCAHPGPAPLTLVASDGRYSLVLDSVAWDEPVASGLDPGEARHLFETNLGLDRCP